MTPILSIPSVTAMLAPGSIGRISDISWPRVRYVVVLGDMNTMDFDYERRTLYEDLPPEWRTQDALNGFLLLGQSFHMRPMKNSPFSVIFIT